MKKILISLSALVITACQTMPYQPYARDVKRKPQTNGIIALKLEHREEDRQKAQQMMNSNCGSQEIKVLEEGEVVVGQESTTHSNTSKNEGTSSTKVGSLFGIPVMSQGTDPSENTQSKVSTSAIKEWQISYECLTKKSAVK
jgi:hypothetical protein